MVRDARGEMRAAVGGQAVGAALERAGEREMHVRPLARQQVVDHDLAQERVAEQVAAFLVGDDQLRRDRFAERVAQRARVDARRVGQRLVVQAAAGGEHAQRLLGVGGEPLDPQHQRVAQRRRERAAAVRARRQQLLGEQRVALAAREQPRDQVVSGRRAEDVGQLLRELLARERAQLDAPVAGVALELGQQRAQRVAAVQLVRAGRW